jgi:hypothetical protein
VGPIETRPDPTPTTASPTAARSRPFEPKPGFLGAVLVAVGVFLLLATVFVPWTAITVSASSSGGAGGRAAGFDTFFLCETVSNSSAASFNSSSVVAGECASYLSIFGAVKGTGRGLLPLLVTAWIVFFLGVAIVGVGAILGLLRRRTRAAWSPSSAEQCYRFARTGAVVALIGGLFLFFLFTLAASDIAWASCGHMGLHVAFSGSCTPSSDTGGASPSGSTFFWAPSYAFYLLLTGFAVVLAGAMMFRSHWRKLTTTPTAPPTPAP